MLKIENFLIKNPQKMIQAVINHFSPKDKKITAIESKRTAENYLITLEQEGKNLKEEEIRKIFCLMYEMRKVFSLVEAEVFQQYGKTKSAQLLFIAQRLNKLETR